MTRQLRDIVLRAEIQAEIEPTTTEEEERRLQLRVGDLATTMGRSEASQKDVAEGLIRDWVAVAHGEQPMRERFTRAMDVLASNDLATSAKSMQRRRGPCPARLVHPLV